MDQQKLLHLLREVLTADTERVKAATTELKTNYYKSPESLPLFIRFLTSQELESQVRQLAATQARSQAVQHWKVIPQDVKRQIRDHLFQSTLEEDVPLLRNAAARVISVIAKLDIAKNEWPDLLERVIIITKSGSSQQREVATFILHAILDSIGSELKSRFGELLQVFNKTIHDSESFDVRINTTRALCSLAQAFDGEAEDDLCNKFQATVPGMVAVLKESIDNSDEARTVAAFEGFQTILTCEPQLLNQHFRNLIEFMANIAVDSNNDDEVRTQALSFLLIACQFRKLKFQSLRIGEQLTMGILQIIVETADEDDIDADIDDDDVTPGSTAIALLNVMTENLSPLQTVAPLLGVFNSFADSKDPARRTAIVRALASCVEGAPDFMGTQLKSFLPGVLRLLQDPVLRVREAAVKSVRELAENLAEDLSKEHETLFKALSANLSRSIQSQTGADAKLNISVIASCCEALEALVDGMDAEDITPYVHELVPHLVSLFSHPEYKIKKAAIGAVGSMALNSEKEFLPFFQDTVRALTPFLTLTEGDEELTLRSISCDTMGNLAQAVGPDTFKSYVEPMMTTTVEGMSLGSPRLRETAFLFWGDMFKVYEADFDSYLPGVMQKLFECLDQEESTVTFELGSEAADLVGKEVNIAGTKVKVAAATDDDSDMDEVVPADGDDDDEWDDITGTSQVAFEKEVAIECLGNICVATPKAFVPFMEILVGKLGSALHHEYEGIQKSAVVTLYRIYGALWEAQEDESAKMWEPGLPSRKNEGGALASFAKHVTPQSLVVWAETDERQAAIEIANVFTMTLRKCGPGIITTDDVKSIIQIITSVVNGQHNSQQDMGDDDDDEANDDEVSEYDWLLIESSLDVLSGLAKALGAQFGEIWKIFEKTVLKYASGEKTQRVHACGVIAECVQGMGSAVTPHTSALLKILLHRLGDEDVDVKANAAFATGVLVQMSEKQQEIVRAYNQILTKLEPMLQDKPSRQLDNAAGCVSRMIMKHKDRVPLNDVLPVLIGVLPLEEDYEENGPVYQMIVGLFLSGESAMTNLAPQLIPVLAQVMDEAEEQLDAETVGLITKLVKFIYERKPDMIQAYPSLVAAAQG